MSLTIKAGTLFTGDQVLFDQTLILDGKEISGFTQSKEDEHPDHDYTGCIVAPAFIDLQLYGAGGKLFNNVQDLETFDAVQQHNLQGGTTRFLITIPTSSLETIFKAIDIVREGMSQNRPGLLGLHLEGPFINPVKRGAHLEEYVIKPDAELVSKIAVYGRGVVKMMTIAPEYFTPELTAILLENGIICSAGHSNASYEESMQGFNNGITAVTHLYNAMSQLGSREAGLAGAAFNHPAVSASIIADGVHVSFPNLEIAHGIMGNRLFLITDSVTESKDGPYRFFKGKNKYVTEAGTLAGSALSMLQAVKNCVEKSGISLSDSLLMASTLPAALIKDQRLGKIRTGGLADLVVFDRNFQLLQVFYEGSLVF